MKKIICLVFASVLILVLSISVFADTPLLSADKSDHADGMPYWYPLDWSGFTDFHGENLPHVVDDADVLTDEEERLLDEKISSIVDEYGIGYVAFTDDDNHGLSPEEYSSDFLHFNGYGVGSGYGAVVFYISFEPGNRCWRTTSINSYERIFNADITYEIDETVDNAIRVKNDYFEGFMLHAEYVENLFKEISRTDNWTPSSHNYVYVRTDERSGPSPLTVIAAGLIVGLIGGAIRIMSLKKKMKIVPPRTANNYLISDSYVVRNRRCDYLYTTLTRHEKPKESSSGGSHGSSFSSGSSAGGSYSSGGRSF